VDFSYKRPGWKNSTSTFVSYQQTLVQEAIVDKLDGFSRFLNPPRMTEGNITLEWPDAGFFAI
jgi:hypothetical protein